MERRAVRDSGERANAREVFLIEEPVAAAIGMGLDISKPIGNIIVDIGGGTTEIAVIALNGVVTKEAIRVAGDEMDESIIQWFRNEHKLDIGSSTAESIKKSVGSAMRIKSEMIAVKGRDLVSGIPKTIEVSSDEIRQSLKDPINLIVEAVKEVPKYVTLAEIKTNEDLQDFALIRQSRLSVVPVSEKHWNIICKMAGI